VDIICIIVGVVLLVLTKAVPDGTKGIVKVVGIGLLLVGVVVFCVTFVQSCSFAASGNYW
jgi:hypothetical protein